MSVAPQPSQKAPKEQKTTKGNVLPKIHYLKSVSCTPQGGNYAYFTKTTENHQEPTREVVPPDACCSRSSSTSPTHEVHAQWMKRQQKPDEGTVLLVARNENHKDRTYSGVGLPKVFRNSPFTLFCGDRYSFSKSSGEIEILPAVRMC